MKMMYKAVALVVLALALFAAPAPAQNYPGKEQAPQAHGFGVFSSYNYSLWRGQIAINNSVASASPATFTVTTGLYTTSNHTISPFFVGNIILVGAGANQDTVTITSVSGCNSINPTGTCAISGNTTHAHGTGEAVTSSTAGLYECLNDASTLGGGVCVVDSASLIVPTVAQIVAGRALFSNASVVDNTNLGTAYAPQLLFGSCAGVPTSASTIYFGVSYATTACTGTTTATEPTLYAPRAGTLRNLACTSTAAGVSSSDGVTTVWVAPRGTGTLAATTITSTIGTGTSASDVTHTVNVVQGQIIQIRQVEAASSSINSPVCTLQLF